jgi:hypothetical protein
LKGEKTMFRTQVVSLIFSIVAVAIIAVFPSKATALVEEIKVVAMGCLDEGESGQYFMELTTDESYLFIAQGPEKNDFDLYLIRKRDNETVAKDTEADSHPLIHYRATESGEYVLKVKAYKGSGEFVVSQVITGIMLGKGDTDYYVVSLKKEQTYHLFGIGSENVDLDMWLYDENGNLIDSDTDSDNIPMVQVTPRWAGKFFIKVVSYRGAGLYLLSGISNVPNKLQQFSQ